MGTSRAEPDPTQPNNFTTGLMTAEGEVAASGIAKNSTTEGAKLKSNTPIRQNQAAITHRCGFTGYMLAYLKLWAGIKEVVTEGLDVFNLKSFFFSFVVSMLRPANHLIYRILESHSAPTDHCAEACGDALCGLGCGSARNAATQLPQS